ncbi:MAG: hypothetical protein RSF86_13680 [Angelakisella sp.]
MSCYSFPTPIPPAGTYLVRILSTDNAHAQDANPYIEMDYDIAVGDYTAFASAYFGQTLAWPLSWRIYLGSEQLVKHAKAILGMGKSPDAADWQGAAGKQVVLTIEPLVGATLLSYKTIRFSSSADYHITPAEIKIEQDYWTSEEKSSWGRGTPTFVRAASLAKLSGLPRLMVDMKEHASGMIHQCAENGIICVPTMMDAFDYRSEQCPTVWVDRKNDIRELAADFLAPARYSRYDIAATIAEGRGATRLVFLICCKPNDKVSTLEDLLFWDDLYRKRPSAITAGTQLCHRLKTYQKYHPTAEFLFCSQEEFFPTLLHLLGLAS